MKNSKRHIDVITMGCSKNLVDSERLLQMFKQRGFIVHHDPPETHGDIAVVNTCGFIQDAKEESIETILKLCQLKEDGLLKRLYVMGCLSQRYREELSEEIPLVDKFYGKFDWVELADELGKTNLKEGRETRLLTTPSHYAYVKISEGCNRRCAYCAIPLITGTHISRPMEEIEEEVRWLTSKGVKEFQIIAQEITDYGTDIYHKQCLPELIEHIAEIPGVEWIRLHYAYPNKFPLDLLNVMRSHDNICKYLDIALQHISDPVLKRMKRHTTRKETEQLIQLIRDSVPGIHLRTTFMVGFPGETDEEFNELLDFARQARFERMGAFAYSEEEGTYAAIHYEDDVPEAVKQQRLEQLMTLQEEISATCSHDKVGKVLKTIIDRKEGDFYIGRTEFDSPEVDCEVLINQSEGELKTGEFYNVLITGSDEFDLYGKTSVKQDNSK